MLKLRAETTYDIQFTREELDKLIRLLANYPSRDSTQLKADTYAIALKTIRDEK